MSKKNKRRHCPALDREITSQDCGADRISRIACPPDCAFNPFGPVNYGDFQEIEKRVIQKTQNRLLGELSPDRVRVFIEKVAATGEDADRCHYLHVVELQQKKDQAGRDFFERWKAEGWKGLNNDERIIVEGHSRVRLALLEIQYVRDDISLQVLDLLEPGSAPFVVVDAALTRHARRFMHLLTWLYPAPHFQRISGTGRGFEPMGPCNALETAQEIVRHLGGPVELPEMREWLARERTRFLDTCVAVKSARWSDAMRRVDAKSGKADYRVKGPAVELADLLMAQPDISECDPDEGEENEGYERFYDVLLPPGEGELDMGNGQPLLGTLKLGEKRLRAEASSAGRFEELKQRLQKVAGQRLEFTGERVEDLAARMLAREGAGWNPALVPPRLLEEPQIIGIQSQRLEPEQGKTSHFDAELRMARAMVAGIADRKNPMLGELTPRAAAAIPAMRPALIKLMKIQVRKCDDMRLKSGLDVDINPLLEELGLHEIVFPPVPLPEIPEDEFEEQDEYDDDDEPEDDSEPPADFTLETVLESVPPAERENWLRPPLRAVMSAQEMDRVVSSLQRRFSKKSQGLIDWFAAEWPDLHDMLDATLPRDARTPARYLTLHQAAAAAWALFGDAVPAENVQPKRLAYFMALNSQYIQEAAALNDPKKFEAKMCEGPQPLLMRVLLNQIATVANRDESLLNNDEMLWIMPFIRSVVLELCMLPPPR